MKHLLFIFIIVILSSCVTSIYPLSEKEEQFVLRKELMGTWMEGESGETVYIVDTVSNKKMYSIQVIDKDRDKKHLFYKAHLVKLGNMIFLDCVLDPNGGGVSEAEDEDEHVGMFIPLHHIMLVTSIEQNKIELLLMEPSTFESLVKNKKISIKHEMMEEDHIVLTEKPNSLQSKLIQPAYRPAFENKLVMKKIAP